MTAHIQRFVDRVRSCEQRNLRELTLSMSEARDLHADITKLLAIVHEMIENRETSAAQQPTITEIDGGTF